MIELVPARWEHLADEEASENQILIQPGFPFSKRTTNLINCPKALLREV
jgi:hypothetical protein